MGDDAGFETLAGKVLERLAESLDELLGDVADVELAGGVLTVALDNGGQYVLNKHAPTRQLWLSSPLSGATHYSLRPEDGAWIGTRDGVILADRLAEELGNLSGRPVRFG